MGESRHLQLKLVHIKCIFSPFREILSISEELWGWIFWGTRWWVRGRSWRAGWGGWRCRSPGRWSAWTGTARISARSPPAPPPGWSTCSQHGTYLLLILIFSGDFAHISTICIVALNCWHKDCHWLILKPQSFICLSNLEEHSPYLSNDI